MSVDKHGNMAYSGTIPENVGDRHYAQDMVRDFWWHVDRAGKVLKDLQVATPCLFSGGLVTKGTGDTLNITPAVGYAAFDVEIPDSWASLPPTKQTVQVDAIRVSSPQQTNMAISSATLDGTTVNYVKLAYAETGSATRQRAKKAGTYSSEKVPSFTISVDASAPTLYQVLLATFTGSSGGAFTIYSTIPLVGAVAGGSFEAKFRLPSNPTVGQLHDLVFSGAALIQQQDAEQSITLGGRLHSTKGVAGGMLARKWDRVRLRYIGAGLSAQEPFVKMSDVADMPPDRFDQTDWSPDGQYVAGACVATPFIYIYKVDGDTWAKLSDPAVLPPATAKCCRFSRSGRYLAVGHGGSPYITIYKRTALTDTWVKLSDPVVLPSGTVNDVAWAPDDSRLYLGHTTTPFITVYSRSADTFTKLADPVDLPPGQVDAIDVSPDGSLCFCGSTTSPRHILYAIKGDALVNLGDLSGVAASAISGARFSPEGQYLAFCQVSVLSAAFIYKRDGQTFTQLSAPSSIALQGQDVCWSPDGQYLCSVGGQVTPWMMVYRRDGDSFLKLADPASLPSSGGSNSAIGCSFSPDGATLCMGSETLLLVRYKVNVGVSKQWFADVQTLQHNSHLGVHGEMLAKARLF